MRAAILLILAAGLSFADKTKLDESIQVLDAAGSSIEPTCKQKSCEPAPTPEPGTVWLCAVALGGFVLLARCRRAR